LRIVKAVDAVVRAAAVSCGVHPAASYSYCVSVSPQPCEQTGR
jgi:hypothetical protein